MHLWSWSRNPVELFFPLGEIQLHPLQCLALQGQLVFAACGTVVKAFKRGKEVDVYLGHEGEVQILLPFGEHLVSIDDKNCLKIWHVRDRGWLMFYLFRFPSHKSHTSVHGWRPQLGLKTYVLDVTRLKEKEVEKPVIASSNSRVPVTAGWSFSTFFSTYHQACL